MNSRKLIPLTFVACFACSTKTAPEAEAEQSVTTNPSAGPRIYQPQSVDKLIDSAFPGVARKIPASELAQMQADLNDYDESFEYVPDAAPKPDPGAPIGDAFVVDAWEAHRAVRTAHGSNIRTACIAEPCLLRPDFDGDGSPDVVLTVADMTRATFLFHLQIRNTSTLVGNGFVPGGDVSWSIAAAADTPMDATADAVELRNASDRVLVYLSRASGRPVVVVN